MSRVSLNDTVTWSEGQLATEVEGEVVLLSVENGAYYGLDDIGSDIWRRLAQPVEVTALCDGLAGDYKAEAEVIRRDVLALLDNLIERGLVQKLN